jgi:alkylation response protein AidB-like acyl-CoA dehydrogenase
MPTSPFAAEHDALRAALRRFADERIAPKAAAWDEAAAYPLSLLAEVAAIGALTVHLPPAVGGADDPLAALVVAEELGRAGSGGTAHALLAHAHGGVALLAAAGGAGDLLTKVAAGTAVVAVAGGPDLHRDGDAVSGVAAGVVDGARCSALLVLADGEALLVEPRDAVATAVPDPLGHRAAAVADVRFDAAPGRRLPAPEGGWHAETRAAVARASLYQAAAAVATARTEWERARTYALDRQAFGRPIGRFQANRHDLAEADTLLVAATQLIHDAVWAAATGLPDAPLRAAQATRFAGTTATSVCDLALQLHGGYGYTMSYDVQRAWRDRHAIAVVDPAGDDLIAGGMGGG